MIASVLVIPAIVLQEAAVGDTWKTVGDVLNWGSWLVFAADIVIMMAVVPDRRGWLRSHPLDLAITVLTPPVVPPGLQFLRVLRLLRPLRLLGALRMRSLLSLEGMRDAAVFAAIVILAGGAVFSEVEPGLSIWDGLWWAIVTVTTVGYGDVKITNTGARITAMILMIVGVGFVALLTAFVANRFIHDDEEGLGRQDEMMANQSEMLMNQSEVLKKLESIEHSSQSQVLAKLESIEKRLERIENAGGVTDVDY